jgi:hypothetical protein
MIMRMVGRGGIIVGKPTSGGWDEYPIKNKTTRPPKDKEKQEEFIKKEEFEV